MTIIGNRLLHADRNLCFVVKYFLLVAFCQMIGNNDPFNCFSYAPINIKPRKGGGGWGMRARVGICVCDPKVL